MGPVMSARRPLVVLSLLWCLFLGCLLYAATILPDRVASHFDAQGRPNDWMSRSAYVAVMAAIGLLLPLFLLAMSLLIRACPNSVINIPRRDYWLSPEHRGEMNAYFASKFAWLACLVTVFVLGVHGLVVDA